jgi:hypothetical protein
MISSAVAGASAFRVTKAQGVSLHIGSGRAPTAASSTAGVTVEDIFDLDCRDVLAAGDDDVFRAVLQLDIAVGMHDSQPAPQRHGCPAKILRPDKGGNPPPVFV